MSNSGEDHTDACTIDIAKTMSLCKYCNEAEDKQDKPGLICNTCDCFVHLACLRRPGTPGDFTCDVFFEFTCIDCSPENEEIFKRNKFPWVNVILLTLHHLDNQSYGISHRGFFHYKTHICTFIDRSWQQLFGAHVKQKKNWVGTIAGVLSVYNNIVFRSGSVVLGEPGWWKLMHGFSPAVAAYIIQELAKEKNKSRPKNQQRSQVAMEKFHFISKVTELGFKDLISTESGNVIVEPVTKKRRTDHETSTVSNTPFYEQPESDTRNDEYSYDDFTLASKDSSYSDLDFRETSFKGFELPPSNQMVSLNSNSFQEVMYYDSDTRSVSPTYKESEQQSDDEDQKPVLEKHKKTEDKPFDKRESLFSTELNSVGYPWMEPVPVPTGDLVEMTPYEEMQLLKQVENLIPKVRDPEKKAELHRLKAKLALRRLKRRKHLPIFDLDKAVKVLGGYVTDDPTTMVNVERVLDRFQRSYLLDNLCGTIASTNYSTLLLSNIEPTPFRSAYSGALLKPYIRRDADSTPTWLKLTDELLKKVNRHVKDYSPPPHATIDYSYVRPQHIAAVNNLCTQFFWPGIDLTEALQYPEFSCVVTYKKLVIGCAFLVPDVKPNEAYISFIFTRPEWRNAKIGSFMLYHLLQTCSGKDVTLHVSPANPAIFLYQKFGFKVEELVQDFYEKYYDIDYKGCRHALFLRLIR